VFLIVCDYLVGEIVTVFQFLMVTSTLESIPGSNVHRHLFVELAHSALLFGSHLLFVVLNESDIFCVLCLAPFSIIFSRNILLLLFRSSILFLAVLEAAGRLKVIIVFHIDLELIINLRPFVLINSQLVQ